MSPSVGQIDHFIMIHAGRADSWRDLTHTADSWVRGRTDRVAVEAKLAALLPSEGFFAFPGAKLLAGLSERIAAEDATGTAALARRISGALLTRSYREHPGEWTVSDDAASADIPDILPPGIGEHDHARPYFEVLYVTSQPAARWPALAAEIRKLRRPEDGFANEGVFVGSFAGAIWNAPVLQL